MTELGLRSPLARFAGPAGSAEWRCAAVAVRELPVPGIVRLQLLDEGAAVRTAIALATGLELPAAGVLAGSGALRCTWVAPAEWLWFTEPAREDALVALLEGCCAGSALATAIGHGRVCIRVEGAAARRVLAKDSGLDFHPAAFGAGRCTITRFARLSVMVAQPDAAEAFELYADRSQAVHLWNFLVDAAAEFALSA